MNRCTVCNEPTENPKYCSNKCRQKGWRIKHQGLSAEEVRDLMNYYTENGDLAKVTSVLEVVNLLVARIGKLAFLDGKYVLVKE